MVAALVCGLGQHLLGEAKTQDGDEDGKEREYLCNGGALGRPDLAVPLWACAGAAQLRDVEWALASLSGSPPAESRQPCPVVLSLPLIFTASRLDRLPSPAYCQI